MAGTQELSVAGAVSSDETNWGIPMADLASRVAVLEKAQAESTSALWEIRSLVVEIRELYGLVLRMSAIGTLALMAIVTVLVLDAGGLAWMASVFGLPFDKIPVQAIKLIALLALLFAGIWKLYRPVLNALEHALHMAVERDRAKRDERN